ncbi:unannotated protein [freshwater metagenome]|uniref:Unannotated protein n=1 Tax=freshwater metagenome TaxID=449393 RepID=A0A6J7L9A0_9ZZZZ
MVYCPGSTAMTSSPSVPTMPVTVTGWPWQLVGAAVAGSASAARPPKASAAATAADAVDRAVLMDVPL